MTNTHLVLSSRKLTVRQSWMPTLDRCGNSHHARKMQSTNCWSEKKSSYVFKMISDCLRRNENSNRAIFEFFRYRKDKSKCLTEQIGPNKLDGITKNPKLFSVSRQCKEWLQDNYNTAAPFREVIDIFVWLSMELSTCLLIISGNKEGRLYPNVVPKKGWQRWHKFCALGQWNTMWR